MINNTINEPIKPIAYVENIVDEIICLITHILRHLMQNF